MSTEKVHLQNNSKSALDCATLSIMLEPNGNQNSVSYTSYDRDVLDANLEIQKYVERGWLSYVTPTEVKKLREARPVEVKRDNVADMHLDIANTNLEKVHGMFAEMNRMLGQLEQVFLGQAKKVEKPVIAKAKDQVPAGETEASVGEFNGTTSSVDPLKHDFIPESAPAGMEPKNDPVRKFFGFSPYTGQLPTTRPMSVEERQDFIIECNDIGMLKEIAIFAHKGTRDKEMAIKKLRSVESQAAGVRS